MAKYLYVEIDNNYFPVIMKEDQVLEIRYFEGRVILSANNKRDSFYIDTLVNERPLNLRVSIADLPF